MLTPLKKMARPYGILFAMALAVAVVARIGLGVMDVTGALSYDYISAANVPLLDVICSILTGSTFVAFLFLAALVLVLSTAGVALQGFLFSQNVSGAGKPFAAFVGGWAVALVAIVCAVVVGSGILSAVQVGSMSSKLPSPLLLVVAAVVFAAFIGSLLAAASLVVCACIARSRKRGRLGVRLVGATLGCGFVVMVLTVGTFSAINTSPIQMGPVLGWFAADVVVNIGMMLVANFLIKRT